MRSDGRWGRPGGAAAPPGSRAGWVAGAARSARAVLSLGAARVLHPALAVVLGTVAASWMLPTSALAASPGPTGAVAGDPRSSGQGPGLVGDPLTAIMIVVAIAVLSLLATLVYVRATGGRTPRRGH